MMLVFAAGLFSLAAFAQQSSIGGMSKYLRVAQLHLDGTPMPRIIWARTFWDAGGGECLILDGGGFAGCDWLDTGSYELELTVADALGDNPACVVTAISGGSTPFIARASYFAGSVIVDTYAGGSRAHAAFSLACYASI